MPIERRFDDRAGGNKVGLLRHPEQGEPVLVGVKPGQPGGPGQLLAPIGLLGLQDQPQQGSRQIQPLQELDTEVVEDVDLELSRQASDP